MSRAPPELQGQIAPDIMKQYISNSLQRYARAGNFGIIFVVDFYLCRSRIHEFIIIDFFKASLEPSLKSKSKCFVAMTQNSQGDKGG
jgi:hypothetical protein